MKALGRYEIELKQFIEGSGNTQLIMNNNVNWIICTPFIKNEYL